MYLKKEVWFISAILSTNSIVALSIGFWSFGIKWWKTDYNVLERGTNWMVYVYRSVLMVVHLVYSIGTLSVLPCSLHLVLLRNCWVSSTWFHDYTFNVLPNFLCLKIKYCDVDLGMFYLILMVAMSVYVFIIQIHAVQYSACCIMIKLCILWLNLHSAQVLLQSLWSPLKWIIHWLRKRPFNMD